MRPVTYRVLLGDVREQLRTLPDSFAQCVVTSPPYWGLRDYGVEGQIGLEETPEAYVSALVDVFREVRRVLAPTGTCWVNLGDSYVTRANGGVGDNSTLNGSRHAAREFRRANSLRKKGPAATGLKHKDVVGVPWRVAFALQADGWWLRSEVIWHKSNPMPEAVTDRPTRAHEQVFLLTKSERYFYDSEAVKQPASGTAKARGGGVHPKSLRADAGVRANADYSAAISQVVEERNLRSVWTLPTQPYPEAHFATFPEGLALPCILSGTRPGDTVLDPFSGSATTGVVALKQGRCYLGVELNPAYHAMSLRRLAAAVPLFAREASVGAA